MLFLNITLFTFLLLIIQVTSQDQSGFVNIDCGSPELSYIDTDTGLTYVSDATFIDTGVPKAAADKNRFFEKIALNFRSFPQGIRNCYKLQQNGAYGFKSGARYLIRARFFYNDYDNNSNNNLPIFDLYLGDKLWYTVTFDVLHYNKTMEIVHVIESNYLYICLVDIGRGTPFISGIELRLLDNSVYVPKFGSLDRVKRRNVAAETKSNIRYPYDKYDRIWLPYDISRGEKINNPLATDVQDDLNYKLPSIVMRTAATPSDENKTIVVTFEGDADWNKTWKYYVYLHFAELQVLQSSQLREFNVYLNGEALQANAVPGYLKTNSIYSKDGVSGEKFAISLSKTARSTLPPILNAFEIYREIDLVQSETEQADVDAITNIKLKYGVKRNWQGDPCFPQNYMWIGLNCTPNGDDQARIVSLNLSSSGLTGEISFLFASLVMIESLDLSNNKLNGSVPNFVSELKSLMVLNLSRNMFTGCLPHELIKRSNDGSLLLSVDEQLNTSSSRFCNETTPKKNNLVVVVAIVVPTLLVTIVGFTILFYHKKIKRGSKSSVLTNDNRRERAFQLKHRYTYNEIIEMTNNFDSTIGEGGFGKVYIGKIDGNRVAVKVLSEQSSQGYQQFEAEVKLLLRVHHTNLTSLVGYCDERSTIGLIYEYMEKGDLRKHLSNKSNSILSWEQRLRIATGSAQGLDYLHHGCKPPIVHRDIKSTNILLNDKFQAKLADFGLSRDFPIEGESSASHISTGVVGTPGFLDPEYKETEKLRKATDVYSFGIVLLEIITGKSVFIETRNDYNEITKIHISQWVKFFLENGDIKNIVDPKLLQDFDMNSAWRVVEVAMSCLSLTSNLRPSMNRVVTELEECLVMEIARTSNNVTRLYQISPESLNVSTQSLSSPLVR